MNRYAVEFFAACPTNGVRIKYQLRIETSEVIRVEELIAFVSALSTGLHEGFADLLEVAFGGRQILTAEHHGVTIETERPWAQ